MKKKYLLFSLLMVLPMLSWAQSYNSALLKDGFSDEQLIVRNWNNQYVVSVYSTGNRQYFACSDFSNFVGPYSSGCVYGPAQISDPIRQGFSINDMRILDNKAFFCGYDNISSQVFVGWFDLPLFMLGNFTPNYVYITGFSSLDKLVVFNHNSDYKIAAIGNDMSPSRHSAVLELDNLISGITSYTQHVLPGYINQERYDNIIFTGNNIVLVGAINFPYPYFYCFVSVFDDLSNFMMSTNYNNIFYFSSDPTDLHSMKTISTFMEDEMIAVAFVHSDAATGQFYTRLRLVDVSALTPTNPLAQEFTISNKIEPMDMVYSSDCQKLTLLQPIKYTNTGYPEFIFLEPYNNIPYTAYYTNFTNTPFFVSLDTYNNNNIVSMGENYAYLQYVPWQTNMGCPNSFPKDVNPVLKSDCINYPIVINRPMINTTVFLPPSSSSYNNTWSAACCSR